MFNLQNDNILVSIDEHTGLTTGIFSPNDKDSMNWILENSEWGLINTFKTNDVAKNENTVIVKTVNEKNKIETIIEKEITSGSYYEKYIIKNFGSTEFFLTKDNFGIPFPYDCLYDPSKDILNKTCINHVWCGGDSAWIYSVKCCADTPYLSMNVIEGAIDDYSINFNMSRVNNASHYRGAIVLHPRECIIAPDESLTIVFRYRFVNEKPDLTLPDYKGAIRLSADKYSAERNEKINILFESESEWESLKLICDGKELGYHKKGNTAFAEISFDTLGERTVFAEVDKKTTLIHINIMMSVSEILEKRAHFIVDNQQYIKPGSHIDGAYLIYDNDTKRMFYDSYLGDHNASRERIGMGLTVCKALQQKYDEKLMNSLKKHREFVERELFDADSGMVYNHVQKTERPIRFYNLPWVSTYYLEWYRLTKEVKCIEYAAKILIKFFEITDFKEDAQCCEVSDICEILEKEKLFSLKEKLTDLFLKYAENLVSKARSWNFLGECAYCSELPNSECAYTSQAYIMTKDKRYLEAASETLKMTMAFFARQPDFHLNCVNVRYWDRYWFGKVRSYGDLFPHYWSTLAAWCMNLYDKANGSDELKTLIKSNLTANLCVYKEDGFASNNYLYPYKIKQYSPDNIYERAYFNPGIFYGKNYDSWSNDQDWALYYASCILN